MVHVIITHMRLWGDTLLETCDLLFYLTKTLRTKLSSLYKRDLRILFRNARILNKLNVFCTPFYSKLL